MAGCVMSLRPTVNAYAKLRTFSDPCARDMQTILEVLCLFACATDCLHVLLIIIYCLLGSKMGLAHGPPKLALD
jgi:hypothetical protein